MSAKSSSFSISSLTSSLSISSSYGATSSYDNNQYKLVIGTDTSSLTSASPTNTSESITLPAGKYRVFSIANGDTASTGSGLTVLATFSNECSDSHYIVKSYSSTSQGTTFDSLTETGGTALRTGANVAAYCISAFVDAPGKTAASYSEGTLTFTTASTVKFQVQQRTATDGSNPAIIRAGSFALFTKIN